MRELSGGNQQNGADDYEDNQHAGENQQYRDRAQILGRLVGHGARSCRSLPERTMNSECLGKEKRGGREPALGVEPFRRPAAWP
jgi:hypothetical protein